MRAGITRHRVSQAAGPSSPINSRPASSTPQVAQKVPFMEFSHPVTIPVPARNPPPQHNYDGRYNLRGPSTYSRSSSVSASPSISPGSSFSDNAQLASESPPSPRVPRRIVPGNFEIEEMRESDYEAMNSDDEGEIIRPHHYEDAESDCGISTQKEDVNTRLAESVQQMVFEDEDDRDVWVQARREAKRLKRRTSSAGHKRKADESVANSDKEGLQTTQLSEDEARLNAKRFRRSIGEPTRMSSDGPPGIPELDEPDSCEEVIEDDEAEVQGVDGNLPFYVQIMDVDSDEDY